MSALASQAEPAASGRIPALDGVRGIAILAMVAYHLVWDVSFFGLIDPAVQQAPWFRLVGATIAATFLFISGVALDRLHRGAATASAFRSRFLRRLAVIAGAAALVSLATYLAMPDAFVRFGILHCMAVGSLAAWPLLGRPRWIAGVAACAVLLVPFLVQSRHLGSDWLNRTGLGDRVPTTIDHVPVAPFVGFVLAGLALAPVVVRGLAAVVRTPAPLRWLGQWSLPIYLIHQPILFGGLWLAASMLGPPATPGAGLEPTTDPDTLAFRQNCRASCRQAGSTADACDWTCACVERDLKSQDLWRVLMASERSSADPRVQAVVQICGRAAVSAPATPAR